MTAKPIRAALYARVSTTGHGQDIGLQLDELRQVAAQRRWTVVNEYTDEGVSGAKDRRPGLDRMMADARAGKLDVVAVWRFDRFARSTVHLLTTLEEFRVLGVEFLSLREQVDTTQAIGKAVFTIISAVTELERDLIRERVVAGVRRAQAAGTHCGRPPVAFDLRPAVALLEQGRGLYAVAKILGVNRSTLRKRLQGEGLWPFPVNKSRSETGSNDPISAGDNLLTKIGRKADGSGHIEGAS